MKKYWQFIKLVFKYMLLRPQNNTYDDQYMSEEVPFSGRIVIEFTNEGQFTIVSDIQDLSDESAQTLGWLLYHIGQGEIINHCFESLQNWADSNKEKIQYGGKVSNVLRQIAQMANDANAENSNKNNNGNNIAVKASQVFNLRGLK